jgi:2-polyprenyl-3-methyl-5-hydroxy-6-metoxy-1,4-benzoquinol methylase
MSKANTTVAGEAVWYDAFYEKIQKGTPPWYKFLIPDLLKELGPDTKLLELGCGQGFILRFLTGNNYIKEENLFAIDQSKIAIEFVAKHLPKANLEARDIYQITYPPACFDIALLMETIEHLADPVPALRKIWATIKPNGILYLSFPNYLHLPWLLVRILAEKLNKPNWIVLQPIDKIYSVFGVVKLLKQAGFSLEQGIGSLYWPPIIYPLEPDWMTEMFNALNLYRFSFHPILKFRKTGAATDPSPGTTTRRT